ncbi:hypothetical protein GTA08_BOTSDO02954 [Neofusicoccum parvum]|nr:hypothetical protein GTA08_BOTSDO02954 [Neofusicoccum parvum]
MVVFKGKACKRCGKQCGEGRLKFKVGKAEAFVKETKVGLGAGEEDSLASPDMFERSKIEARLSFDEWSREWSQESVDGMEGKQEARKDGDEPTMSSPLPDSDSSTFGQLRSRRGLPPLKVAIPNVTVESSPTSATKPSQHRLDPDLSPDAQQSFNVSQALEAITQCLDRIDQL